MKRSLLDDRRVVLGGTAAVAVVLLALTWFIGVGPQLSAASEADTQRADAELQYATLQTKIAALAEKNEGLAGLEAALVQAQGGLPATTALPAFTRQVSDGAADAGVSLEDVSISAPTGAATAAQPEQAATEGDQAEAGPAGAQAIGITLTTKGTLREQVAFVKGLQDGDRRALVSSTQISVGDSKVASIDAPNTMTTQVTIFTAAPTA